LAGAKQGQPDGELIARFSAALDEDLNVAGAWGAVFDWVRDTNRRLAEKSMDASSAVAALATWEQIDRVFGVGSRAEAAAPAEITALLEAREAARKSKDFKRADAVRNELKSMGWLIEDTPKGPRLKRI
jgi:cysteinyl-tRNA synthetase